MLNVLQGARLYQPAACVRFIFLHLAEGPQSRKIQMNIQDLGTKPSLQVALPLGPWLWVSHPLPCLQAGAAELAQPNRLTFETKIT